MMHNRISGHLLLERKNVE